jgi:type IV pilus assembly protein PilQ
MNRLRSALVALAMLVIAASPVAARGPGDSEVISVALTSAPGSAEIMIGIRGGVQVRDFILSGPDRLVLDVAGATLTANLTLYDGVERAGIKNIRYAQFAPSVVRVVIDLSERKSYTVETSEAGIRVKFGAERAFLSWSSLSPAEMPSPVVAVRPGRNAGRSPEVVLAGSDVSAQQGARRISVVWEDASIADVAAGFAALSGRSIIIGAGIDRTMKVTAELKDVPWDEAFRAVLAAQGLSANTMPGGVIRIDSPRALAALDSLEPLETRLVRVNYANVGSLSRNLSGLVTKNRGIVVADSSTNGLIITDTRSRIDAIVEFVQGLDQPTPLVSIQAKIILVDREDIQALGVQYDIGAPGVGQGSFFNEVVPRPGGGAPDEKFVDLGGSSLAAVGNSTSSMTDAALRIIATTTFGDYSLTAFLQAVQTVNLADVQAEPMITTLDNTPADLLVGEETPVRIIDAGSVSSGAPVATVQYKETGIRLTVTPHVTNNRNVMLTLKTERSALQELAAADLGFNFQKQTATNKLLVDDGETAVIGGLTLTQVLRTRQGIPILMSIPVIGNIFAFNRTSERRRDLIILVTPRIVESPAMTTNGGR